MKMRPRKPVSSGNFGRSKKLSVPTRLTIVIVMIVFSGLLGLFGAIQINKAATLHKLNFLHIKYNHAFFERVITTQDYRNNFQLFESDLLMIRAQPLACLKVLGLFERALMKALGTDRAVELCDNDIALANRTLLVLEEYARGSVGEEDMALALNFARNGFQRNSDEFEPLVDRTVDFVFSFVLVFLIISSSGTTIFAVFLAQSVAKDYKRSRETEMALNASQELLLATGRLARVGGWEYDVESGEMSCSEETYRIQEMEPGEKLDLGRIRGFFSPEDKTIVASAFRDAVKKGKPFDMEVRMQTALGNDIWAHTMGKAMTVDGRVVQICGAVQDISKRKRAEEAAKKSEQLLLDAVKNITFGTVMMNSDGLIESFNPAAERIFGFEAGEVIGKNVSMLAAGNDRENHHNYVRSYLDSKQPKIIGIGREVTGIRKNGKEFPMHLGIGEIHRSDSVWFVASIEDLSERKALEEQLRHSQKMDAIGKLTGGIAHDFNNLLAVITGNLTLLADDLKIGKKISEEDVLEPVEASLDASRRGAELTYRLLAFSSKQTLQASALDLNAIVGDGLELLTRTLGESIEIETILKADDGWYAQADPSQLTNAFLNLALNARDAIKGSGKLIIETRDQELSKDYCDVNHGVRPGEYVMLAVSDNGCGMSKQVLESVFEPFFTTKGLGSGTGLGLSMVYGFVKQSGGHIDIYSEPGHGTTVKIFLPRAEGKYAVIPAASRAQTATGAGEQILIVEDDPKVLSMVTKILRHLGYNPTQAADAATAIEILKNGFAADLLLCDVVLGGNMNGPQLADAAHKIRGDIPVLFMSGYTENALLVQGHIEKGAHLIPKPFSVAELAISVKSAIT